MRGARHLGRRAETPTNHRQWGLKALKQGIANVALECVPRNAARIDFERRPVSEGHVWYIVRFAGGGPHQFAQEVAPVYKDPS